MIFKTVHFYFQHEIRIPFLILNKHSYHNQFTRHICAIITACFRLTNQTLFSFNQTLHSFVFSFKYINMRAHTPLQYASHIIFYYFKSINWHTHFIKWIIMLFLLRCFQRRHSNVIFYILVITNHTFSLFETNKDYSPPIDFSSKGYSV